MSQTVDISIIVPVYNVVEYLIPCLDSIGASRGDFTKEVILVDDGSTDNSGQMAEEYANDHEDFLCLHKENGGLGSARNYGVDHASGKYICFIDSDDIVEDDMFFNMFSMAEKNGSDLTTCNMARFNSARFWPSGLHMRMYNHISGETCTHITKMHDLVHDTTATNKLIKKSFFIENGFRFPENRMLFEDIPLTTPMHYLANNVSIVHKPEYLWRSRDGASSSITQNNTNIKNLQDRLTVLKRLLSFFDQHVTEEDLRDALEKKIFTIDLMVYTRMCDVVSVDMARDYMKILNEFIDKFLHKDTIKELPLAHQQIYHYLFENDLGKMRKAIAFSYAQYYKCKINRIVQQYYIELPPDIYCIEDRAYTDREILNAPKSGIIDYFLRDDSFTIQMYVFMSRISCSEREDQSIEAKLVSDVQGNVIDFEVEELQSSYVTDSCGVIYNQFSHSLDHYDYSHNSYTLRLNREEIERLPEGDYCIIIDYENRIASRSLMLRQQKDNTAFSLPEDTVFINEKQITVYFDANNCMRIIIKNCDEENAVLSEDKDEKVLLSRDSHCAWLASVKDDHERVKLELYTNLSETGKNQLIVEDEIKGTHVILSEDANKPADQDDSIVFDIALSGKKCLEDFYESKRVVYYTNGKDTVPVLSASYCRQELYKDDTLKVYLKSDRDTGLMLHIEHSWDEENLSSEMRKYYQQECYVKDRKQPVWDKTILFESMWGAKYSGSPKAFYEYMDSYHPEYTCVWAFEDERMPINGNGIRVRRGSKQYYEYLARAKYLLNDVNFPSYFKKRFDQVMIQTMHGTPYKKLGLDVRSDFRTNGSIWGYVRKNMNWDYVISQGKFTDSMVYTWYKFYKTVLKTGYPRTDALYSIDTKRIEQIKDDLGIDKNKKVILYAPTWRTKGEFRFELDFDRLMQAIGEEAILAVRIHHLSAQKYSLPEHERIIDLTDYNSIEDLYQIADVIITDYSSVMFDYALLERPIVFYAYDLEEYSEQLRGVYFDLKTEAPGPVATSFGELIEILSAIEEYAARYQDRRDAFMDKYLTYENQSSCERVYQEVFVKGKKTVKSKLADNTEKVFEAVLPKKFLTIAEKIKIHLICLRARVWK